MSSFFVTPTKKIFVHKNEKDEETNSPTNNNECTVVKSYDQGEQESCIEQEVIKTIDKFSRKAIDDAFGNGTSNMGFTKRGVRTTKVEKASPAVADGRVLLKSNGQVDRRSAAIKQGLVILDDSGEVVKKDSSLCKDKELVLIEKDGCHIHSFEMANTISQRT